MEARPPEAHRLTAYLEGSLGALVMGRTAWESLEVGSTDSVISVQETPVGSLAREACFIGATARRSGLSGTDVSIYRRDQKDAKPVNVDHYTVMDLASNPHLGRWVVAASTRRNANLDAFLTEHVVWVKEKPGTDHWLTEPPLTVEVVVERAPPGPSTRPPG